MRTIQKIPIDCDSLLKNEISIKNQNFLGRYLPTLKPTQLKNGQKLYDFLFGKDEKAYKSVQKWFLAKRAILIKKNCPKFPDFLFKYQNANKVFKVFRP